MAVYNFYGRILNDHTAVFNLKEYSICTSD